MAHYHSPAGKANKPQRKRRQARLGIETAKRVRVATPNGWYHLIPTNDGYRMPGDNTTLYKLGAVILLRGELDMKGAYPTIDGMLPKGYECILIRGDNITAYVKEETRARLNGKILVGGEQKDFIIQPYKPLNNT